MDTTVKSSVTLYALDRYARGFAIKKLLDAEPNFYVIENGPGKWDFLIKALAQLEEVRITVMVPGPQRPAACSCGLVVSGADRYFDRGWVFRGYVIGSSIGDENAGYVDGYLDLNTREGKIVYLTGRRSELGRLESEFSEQAMKNWSETASPEIHEKMKSLEEAIFAKKEILGLNRSPGIR